MRGLEVGVRYDGDLDAVTRLDLPQGLALLVEQEAGDLDGDLGDDAPGLLLHRLFLDQAQDRQRQGFHAADGAVAGTAGTDLLAGLAERGAQALAGHLQQAEARDAPDLHARAVHLEGVAQAVLDGALVLRGRHVDEVDDDQAAEVAQAELAGDLVGGLEVGVERGLLDVAALGGARRVDVDGRQGLGVVDDHGAARGQTHLALEGRLDLALDLIAVKEGDAVLVELELTQVVRHHLLDEVPGLVVDRLVVDDDLADVGAEIVAQRADDDVAFLIDEDRGLELGLGLLDRLPELEQVVHVPLELFGAAADAGGAHDHAHALGDVELSERLTDLGAVVALDAPRYAARTGVVGHQDEVAAGQGDEGGEGGALVAALLLLHLYEDFLALFQGLLDRRTGILRLSLGGEVGAGDFFEGQEAVTLGPVIDEGGLEGGLNPGDDTLVDIGLLLLP